MSLESNSVASNQGQIIITPEMYANLPEASKATLPPLIRSALEAALKSGSPTDTKALEQAIASSGIPHNTDPIPGSDPSDPDDGKSVLAMLDAARAEYRSKGIAERRKQRAIERYVTKREWKDFQDIDPFGDDLVVLLVGGVGGGLLVIGSYFVIKGLISLFKA